MLATNHLLLSSGRSVRCSDYFPSVRVCVCTLAVSDRQQPGQIKSKGVRSAAGKSVRSNEIEERCASSRCAGKRGDPARPRLGLRVQGGGLSVMRDGGDEGRVETFWQLLLGLKYRNTVVLDFQD